MHLHCTNLTQKELCYIEIKFPTKILYCKKKELLYALKPLSELKATFFGDCNSIQPLHFPYLSE